MRRRDQRRLGNGDDEVGGYDYGVSGGLTLTAQAALLTQRYVHVYGMPVDGLAEFPCWPIPMRLIIPMPCTGGRFRRAVGARRNGSKP